jgi:hypothetical protein
MRARSTQADNRSPSNSISAFARTHYRKYGNSFDNLDLDEFDYLMAVVYDLDTYRVQTVHRIPVSMIREIGLKSHNRLRWALDTQAKCEQFKIYP